MEPFDNDEPIYSIGVVARRLKLHEQTLRLYERLNLVSPKRSAGKNRLYSQKDLERLELLRYLAKTCGLNRAGLQLMAGIWNVFPQVEWFLISLLRSGKTAPGRFRLSGAILTPSPDSFPSPAKKTEK